MKLASAETLALRLMRAHGLAAWKFQFDRARRRFGLCNYTAKTISLSRHLTELHHEIQVRDTILHEIAHALTPGAGHGPRWQEKCREVGARPERLFRGEGLCSRYLLVCLHCGLVLPRERKTRRPLACKRCCDAFSGGKYSSRYVLSWQRVMSAPKNASAGAPKRPAAARRVPSR